MSRVRTGIGIDAHRFAAGRRLVLGGVRIAHERGLLGHSDADVLCHAVADALLGAAAAGDIGQHFPDTDPRWKGASSLDLLRRAAAIVRAAGLEPAGVDVTVLAERPRLAPHSQRMRGNVAGALGIAVELVSVKATTTEGMGALGRGEGIAAFAVATVERTRVRRRGRGR
jgi:2-C-methyl-D-erythritol 2,4-cyclodiphosphate synthase